jgi:SAM-dependent methyltransferase
MPDVNSPEFWEKLYQAGRDHWDLGQPTPVFKRLLESGQFSPGSMIVLGAGRGYDARMFARHGFEVTAVDFAEEVVSEMKARSDPEAPIEIIHTDLFDLPNECSGRFDYVLEYTCFCAIDPQRRLEYADLVWRLLKPGGTFIVLLFPVSNHEGGPPFAVHPDEFGAMFSERGFGLTHREIPSDSVSQRQGIEELLIFQM